MFRDEANTPEYKEWRKGVYARDGHKCVACSKKGYLNAHHLNGWSWYVEGRYDVDNGVTLCYKCHKKFHDIYGKGNNTRDEFMVFLWEFYGKTL